MKSEELKQWLETISKIIFDIQISLTNAERLFESKYENEDQIKNHGFFRHHYYQLWFIMTIQLCKLLTNTKTQKFNLHKLLQRLRSEALDNELVNLIVENSKKPFVKVFRSIAEFEEHVIEFQRRFKDYDSIIQKLKTSRDTLYAHEDHDAIPQNVSLDDVKLLQNFCIEIHNRLRGGFYDESVLYHNTSDWSIDFVLKQCSRGRSNSNS